MPKSLDQILKEAVAHREKDYQNIFFNSSTEQKNIMLNEELQRLDNEKDGLIEIIEEIQVRQLEEEFEKTWKDKGADVVLEGLSWVPGYGNTISMLVDIAKYYSSSEDFIDECQLKLRENAKKRGNCKLAIQQLGGTEKGTVQEKKRWNDYEQLKKQDIIQKETEKTKEENKKERKKRQSNPLGEGPVGKKGLEFLLGSNENVEPSSTETIPEAVQSTPTDIATPTNTDSDTVKSVSNMNVEATTTPTETPRSAAIPTSIDATPKTAETTTPTQQTQQSKPRLPFGGDRGKFFAYERSKAIQEGEDVFSPEWEEKTSKKWKEIVENNKNASNQTTPQTTVQPTQTQPVEASPKQQEQKQDSTTSEITYDVPTVQAKIEQIANETDKQFTARISEKTKDMSGLQQDIYREEEENVRTLAKHYVKTKDDKLKKELEQFFAAEFNLIKFDDADKQSSSTASPSVPSMPSKEQSIAADQVTQAQPKATTEQPIAVDQVTQAQPKATTEQPIAAEEVTQTQPKSDASEVKSPEATPKKESSYDVTKVTEYIKSVANESNEELRARVKEERKDKSERSIDIGIKRAEFNRQIAQEYLKTDDPVKKSQLEQTFIGKVPGVSVKDHAQHLLDLQEVKSTQSSEIQPKTEQTVSQAPPTDIPSITEPKPAQPPESSYSTELMASTSKSGSELNAVRESMVEDKMMSQQSQSPAIIPIPMSIGNGRPAMVASSDSPSDGMIPMVIVNDEEIIRMNSFDAYKLRML